jgi:hypothetical protein
MAFPDECLLMAGSRQTTSALWHALNGSYVVEADL